MNGAVRLRIHHFLPSSRANGPGWRAVIWVQGCSLACPGCFNRQTHSFEQGAIVKTEKLFDEILSLRNSVEGITISGGEPLQQRRAVTELLRLVKEETSLSTILFTGYTWKEIQGFNQGKIDDDPPSSPRVAGSKVVSPKEAAALSIQPRRFLDYVDVLIAGRYEQQRRLAFGLRGSVNKTVHFLTARYNPQDLEDVPPSEVIVAADGDLMVSGIEPVSVSRAVHEEFPRFQNRGLGP